MTKKKMAIIGTGIAGMSAGYFLHEDYDITVFEKMIMWVGIQIQYL